MTDYLTVLTGYVDGVPGVGTRIMATYLNAIENSLGVRNSSDPLSLDYLVRHSSSIDPGHKHSKLYASDGSPEAVTVDATGIVTINVTMAAVTMSGNIAMGSNKVTGLAAASGAGEAVRYDEYSALTGTPYLSSSSIDPGHKHSELWASDGSPQAVDIDADGNATFNYKIGVGGAPGSVNLVDIGGSLTGNNAIYVDVTVTSSVSANGLSLAPTLAPENGSDAYYIYVSGTTVAPVGETIPWSYGINIDSTNFLKSGTGTITNACALYIAAPTIGATNYVIYNPSGNSYHNGDIALNSHKITGLAAASGAGEAVRYDEWIATQDPGHKHSELWASDGDPQALDIDASGNITFNYSSGIGIAPVSYVGLTVGITTSGNASQYGVMAEPTFNSSATTSGTPLYVKGFLAAGSYTCTSLYNIYVANATKGLGSSITTQYGLYVADMSSGGTNYSIYTETAQCYFGGNVQLVGTLGIGQTPAVNMGFYLGNTLSGSTGQIGTNITPTFDSSCTSSGYGVSIALNTAAASFTCTNVYGINISDVTVGSGSTVTNQVGIYVGDLTSGGSVNYAIYTAGTTGSYFGGNVSAESFTDRTPFFAGETPLAAIMQIKGRVDDPWKLDHSSLPEFAQAADGYRNLSAMTSIHTAALQELGLTLDEALERITDLEVEIEKLKAA